MTAGSDTPPEAIAGPADPSPANFESASRVEMRRDLHCAESERLVGVLVARTRAPVSPVFRTKLLAGPKGAILTVRPESAAAMESGSVAAGRMRAYRGVADSAASCPQPAQGVRKAARTVCAESAKAM